MQIFAIALTFASTFLLLFKTLYAEKQSLPSKIFEKKNLEVKLIEPNYNNGILTTTKGGTIKGEDFFLQAKNISYIRRTENGKPVQKILADGDLFFLFKGKAYTGKKIEVDVEEKKSIIYDGCTFVDPWYMGGRLIELNSDGSGTIHDGYMTTSENEKSDWSIESPTVKLTKGSKVKARSVSFKFIKLPIFWLPTFSTDLKRESRTPFKYRYRVGGRLGPRIGITYEALNHRHFKTNLLLDILLKKGLGGGIEAMYENPDNDLKFYSFNYAAHDLRSKTDHKWLRYRFKGSVDDVWFRGKGYATDDIYVNLSYDKLSDLDMRSDYTTDKVSGRIAPTQLKFCKKTYNTISSLNTKVRVNTFQTIKQELPLFQFNVRPQPLGTSGLIVNNRFNAGYLNYRYDHEARGVRNFESTRSELSQAVYRNFYLRPLSVTPRAAYTFINYSRSPNRHGNRSLIIGKFGADANMRFMRPFLNGQQIAEPYVQYDYMTTPSIEPRQHYLFDIQDGWHRMNLMRFGLKNFFMTKSMTSNFFHRFNLDVYARAFFHTEKVPRKIPRVYADASWKATPYMTYFLNSAWDTKRDKFDHINVGSLVTVTDDIALTLEYRQRDAFCWRKVDTENFTLDFFRSERDLRHSQVSDRRNTILTGLFFRLTPELSAELKTQHGWKRHHLPAYHAYEIDVVTLLRGAVKLRFSIDMRSKLNKGKAKNSTRYSFDIHLGADRPRTNAGFRRIGQGNYDN